MKLNKFILILFVTGTSIHSMNYMAPDGVLGENGIKVVNNLADVANNSIFGANGSQTINNASNVIGERVKTVSQTVYTSVFGPGGVQTALHNVTQVVGNVVQTVNKAVEDVTGVIRGGIGEVHEAIKVIDKKAQKLNEEIGKTNAEIANANKTFATLTATFKNFFSKLDPPDRLAKTFGLGLMGLYVGKIGLQFLKVGIQKTIENNSNEHDKDTNNDKTIILTPERKKGLIMCACGLGFLSIGGYGMLHPGTIVNYFSH